MSPLTPLNRLPTTQRAAIEQFAWWCGANASDPATAHREAMTWHGWTRLCARLAVKGTPSKIGAAGAHTFDDPADERIVSNLLNRH